MSDNERQVFIWRAERVKHLFEDSDTFIKDGAIAIEVQDEGGSKTLELMCLCMRPNHTSCGSDKRLLEVKTPSSEWEKSEMTFQEFLDQKRCFHSN